MTDMAYGFLMSPQRLYLTRLADDEREPTKIVVGTCVKSTGRVFLRGAMDPDSWDRWKGDAMWNVPQPLAITVTHEPPGIVLRVSAMVPLRELPREQWGPFAPDPAEAWKGEPEPPPEDAMGLLALGNLTRYERAFKQAGHPVYETADILNAAMAGKTMEPFEQGLG